jgi:peptidyl-prolyl cis-trans isomerase C
MRLWALVSTACALSCSAEPPPRTTASNKALPEGVAASVGSDLVAIGTVARIASARGIDRSRARDLAVRDALFAAAARDSPAHSADVTVADRANLGRALLESFEKQAKEAGPATDAEVNELTAARWIELDRPPSVRTSHAVVLVKKPEDAAPARALAERLAAALRDIAKPAEFLERARAFPAPLPLSIVAEQLSPVTSDGRMWEVGARPGTQFPSLDPDYTRAAHAIAHPGEQSPVVKSAFGYHVILLEERLPEQRMPLEERRALLEGDIASLRAKKVLEATVLRLRQATPVEVVRTADSLTALVATAP